MTTDSVVEACCMVGCTASVVDGGCTLIATVVLGCLDEAVLCSRQQQHR